MGCAVRRSWPRRSVRKYKNGLDKLTREVQNDWHRRVALATPGLPGLMTVPGAERVVRDSEGRVVWSIRAADEAILRDQWGWEMTSHPVPLSGRIRKRIRRKR